MNNPKLAQEVEPFEDRIDILFREIELAVKWQRPSILLAIYSSEYVHADAEAALEKQLVELGQKVLHFQVRGEENADVASLISKIGEQDTSVFFVDGLRWGGRRDGFNTYKSLNICRDYFVSNRIRVVFWLTEGEAVDLAHYAPDYWAFRHRVIEFVEVPEPEAVLARSLESAWQGAGCYEEDPEDMDAKISLRSALLSGLPEGDESASVRADLSLTLGMLHWRKGQAAKAAEYMRSALDIAGRTGNTWLEAVCFNAIALVQTDLGRADEAIQSYQRAAQLAPDQIFPWNNLGNLYSKLARNEEAMAAFQKAIRHNPRDAVSWNGLGNVCLELGRNADAAAAYRRALEVVPDYAAPWNGLGNVYARSSQLEEAVAAYQKAIGCDRHNLDSWINLGNLFKAQGRNRDAIKAYREAAVIDPNNAYVWNELGNAYFAAGDQAEAVNAYQMLAAGIAEKSAPAEISADSSPAEDHLRDYAAALEAFQTMGEVNSPVVEQENPVQERDPNETQPHRPARVEEAAIAAAIEAAEQPAGIKPALRHTDGTTPSVQAEAPVVEVAQPLEADASTGQPAEGLDPQPNGIKPVVRHADGTTPSMQPSEEFETEPLPAAVAQPAAQADRSDEITVEAANAHVWNELGNIYYNAGSYDQAAGAYVKAIGLNPGFGWPYSNLALAHAHQGRYAEAIPLYQKSIDLLNNDKDRAITWDRLGDAYRRLNDYDNAIAAYQMSDQLKPADAPLGSELREVMLEQIERNPRQPRAEIEVEELVESVREHGIIQPLIVTPGGAPGKYVLIAGERRLEAARQAGLGKVPVIVRQASDQQRLELALIENVQRSDLNPLELADAYRQLAEDFELSHEEIALRVGKSRVAVTNTLRLLKLSEAVKAALTAKQVSEGHARSLIRLGTAQLQDAALDYIVRNGLSVRQAEELVRELKGETPREKSGAAGKAEAVDAALEQDKTSLLSRARFMLSSDRHAERNSHQFSYRSGG